jgi:hypothetical protein
MAHATEDLVEFPHNLLDQLKVLAPDVCWNCIETIDLALSLRW